ncbi:MAG: GGDEF domain-containing protein [Salinibacter sp.]
MMRALLAFLAATIVVLAFVLDRGWLYGAAAATLVGTLGYLGRYLWRASRRGPSARDPARAPTSADDSLENLGIVDVRPREEEQEGVDGRAPDAPAAADESGPTGTGGDGSPPSAAGKAPAPAEWPESALSDRATTSRADSTTGSRYTDDRPVLGPFLESLRAALGSTSACLLVQEEVALEYRIEALASAQPDVQLSGSFETMEPLLSASMSRQPVTVHSIDPSRHQDLGYYTTAPEITQVALAPVARPDSAATMFLLADATATVDLGTSAARAQLERFADLLPTLLDAEQPAVGAGPPTDDGTATDQSQGVVDAGREAVQNADDAADDADASGGARPRRDIIAEEMVAADAADAAMALVLVHLNRAESIARRGEEAVASAERHLQSRLEDLAPGLRVERFGELTYGLFVRRSLDEVEEWAAELQEAMARETGELEGGVSVGVAVRHDGHDPESLRADATDALLEAYETGTCTIVA